MTTAVDEHPQVNLRTTKAWLGHECGDCVTLAQVSLWLAGVQSSISDANFFAPDHSTIAIAYRHVYHTVNRALVSALPPLYERSRSPLITGAPGGSISASISYAS